MPWCTCTSPQSPAPHPSLQHLTSRQAVVVWAASDSTAGGWKSAAASFSTPARHLWIAEATPTLVRGVDLAFLLDWTVMD